MIQCKGTATCICSYLLDYTLDSAGMQKKLNILSPKENYASVNLFFVMFLVCFTWQQKTLTLQILNLKPVNFTLQTIKYCT